MYVFNDIFTIIQTKEALFMSRELPEFEFDMIIGRTLQKWRKEKKITQKEMADKLGTARQSIINIEQGATHTKSYTIYKVAHITGKDPSDIYTDIEDEENNHERLLLHILKSTKRFTFDMLQAVNDIIEEAKRGNLRAILHLFSMYLRLPMRDRQNLALLALNCYKTALSRNEIEKRDFMPDIDIVEKSQESGWKAAINNKESYSDH